MTWERYGKECREEGREEGIRDMVAAMIKEKIPTEVIVRITNVPLAEVEAIKESMNVNA